MMKQIRWLALAALVFGFNPCYAEEQNESPVVKEIQAPQEKPLDAAKNVDSEVQKEMPKLHAIEDLDAFKTEEPDNFMSQFTHMLTTLGILLALLIGVTWVLKKLLNSRLQQINSQSDIKILDSRNLSAKTTIHVLEIYGNDIVIAESVNGVTRLLEFPADKELKA